MVGLFVSDWRQTVGILLIVGAGLVAVRVVAAALIGFAIAGLLAAHLLYGSVMEARQRLQALEPSSLTADKPQA